MEKTELKGSILYDAILPLIEKIGLLLTLVGLFVAWTLIGHFEMLLLVGLQTLAITFFLRAFKPQASGVDDLNFPSQYFSNKDVPVESMAVPRWWEDGVAPKVVNIACACVLVGSVFKAEFWKGGDLQLMVGEIPLIILIVLMGLQQQFDRRALLIAILGGLMLSVSSETLMRQLHRDDPRLVDLMVNQLRHPHDRAANEALRAYQHEKRIQR